MINMDDLLTEFNARAEYSTDGTTDSFHVPFSYLSPEFLIVYINGERDEQAELVDTNTMRTSHVPEYESIVTIQRVTELTRRVDFQNASLLDEVTLNEDSIQMLHIVQEAYDELINTIGRGTDYSWDAQGVPIRNLGDPTEETDAMNYRSAKQSIEDAEQARDVAIAEANKAEQEAIKALEEAERALTQANVSQSEAEKAFNEAQRALSEANKAESEATRAKQEADIAKQEADSAKQEADRALSEANKAESEAIKANNEADRAEQEAVNADVSADFAKQDADRSELEADRALSESDKADRWANELKNVEVEAGKYSGRHYSEVASDEADRALSEADRAEVAQTGSESAQGFAETAQDGAETAQDLAETAQAGAELAETNASISETNALASENKADKWAEEAEDIEVETGKYSAKHHSSKAQTAQGLAETAQTDAETARTGAETAQGLAETAKTDAETARTGAETAQTGVELAETNAGISETNALSSAELADKFANETEDVEVKDGKYSAKHWATKAEQKAGTFEPLVEHGNEWHTDQFTNAEDVYTIVWNEMDDLDDTTNDLNTRVDTLESKPSGLLGSEAPPENPMEGQVWVPTKDVFEREEGWSFSVPEGQLGEAALMAVGEEVVYTCEKNDSGSPEPPAVFTILNKENGSTIWEYTFSDTTEEPVRLVAYDNTEDSGAILLTNYGVYNFSPEAGGTMKWEKADSTSSEAFLVIDSPTAFIECWQEGENTINCVTRSLENGVILEESVFENLEDYSGSLKKVITVENRDLFYILTSEGIYALDINDGIAHSFEVEVGETFVDITFIETETSGSFIIALSEKDDEREFVLRCIQNQSWTLSLRTEKFVETDFSVKDDMKLAVKDNGQITIESKDYAFGARVVGHIVDGIDIEMLWQWDDISTGFGSFNKLLSTHWGDDFYYKLESGTLKALKIPFLVVDAFENAVWNGQKWISSKNPV